MTIIFCTDNMPWSIFIRWFCWSNYHHCGLVKDNEVIHASFRHGIIKQNLYSFCSKYKKIKFCHVDNVNQEKAWNWALKQVGKNYDWKALFGLLLRKNFYDDNKYFCSELIECAIYQGGVELIRKEASRVTPQNLLDSPLVIPD